MDHPIVYDITRLATRVFNATPNGIDRVDMALARYFLNQREAPGDGMLFLGPLGYRVIKRAGAIDAIDAIHNHFGEDDDPEQDASYQQVKHWLQQGAGEHALASRISSPSRRFAGKAISWMARHGAPLRNSPARSLPPHARYINVSQYPLAIDGAFAWQAARPDVKMVFFIHDMLPLQTPEYFRAGEFAAHQRRLRNVARHGAGAIVSTQAVKEALQKHIAKLGRGDLPILVAPLPVAPIFLRDEAPDNELSAEPFFVQCGTLEPRKNHLMILHIWRELVTRHGSAAPKLILVGARGWENENIIDLLERCAPLRHHVLEVSGLATPSVKRLMKAARAVLMPSFAEGYGLPLAEALALGTPAIASDIPVFREIAGDHCTSLSPIDGEGWMRAIELAAQQRSRPFGAGSSGDASAVPDRFFRAIDEFVNSL
ncbi:glycosyltransferase family 1 protein [Methylocapsa sp. S129]|uniref:glycosyltransferase family 4 protein n=1 Tax=Methylocapsa sp. S129 TaxID=1641869 RepID=UPI00131C856B|nr:glycosyltransferase family 1 protein [Methylocapsa sp. S129]